MKNSSVILNVVLLLAIIPLYVFQFGSDKESIDVDSEQLAKEKEIVSEPIDSNTIDDIIVYYNRDTVIHKSPLVQELFDDLKKSGTRMMKKKEKMQSDYYSWIDTENRKLEAGQLTQMMQQMVMEESARKQNDMIVEAKRLEELYRKKELKTEKQIFDAIYESSKELNLRRKVRFILSYSQANNFVIPLDGAVDVTSDMVEIMNEKFPSTKATKPKK